VFVKMYQCSLTKKYSIEQCILDCNYNRLDQKGKLSLIQIIGVQSRYVSKHNKVLGISYELHMLFK